MNTREGVKVTNADKIRSMTDRELAKWLEEIYDQDYFCTTRCPYFDDVFGCDSNSCAEGLLEWLKQETKNNMSNYKCKVRIIRDTELTVYAKNKNEAEKEAKNLCKYGFGFPLGEHTEVLEIERMTAKKKAQERDENGKDSQAQNNK